MVLPETIHIESIVILNQPFPLASGVNLTGYNAAPMPAEDLVCSGVPIHVEPSAKPLLESGVGNLAPRVLEIISAEKEKGLPIKSVDLTAFVDPEDGGRQELVFSVSTESSPAEALKAWDRLSDKIRGDLRDQLTAPEARLLDEQVCINVEWV